MTSTKSIAFSAPFFMFLAFVACLLQMSSHVANAQVATISIDDAPISNTRIGNELDYLPARAFISLRNRFPEEFKIDAVEVELVEFVADNRPNLIIELIPYFDCLAARAINIGWGKSPGGSLNLIAPARPTDVLGPDLRSLLDIVNTRQRFYPFVNNALFVYRLGAKAVPFTFVTHDEYSVERMRRPPPFPGLQAVTTSTYTVSHLVEEMRIRPEFQYRYSGLVTFPATLQLGNARPKISPLFGRTFSRCPESKGDWTSDAAGLYSSWELAFGQMLGKPVYETKTREQFGVTFDIANGQRKVQRFKAKRSIAPNESLDFTIEFVSNRSANFGVRVLFEYRFGNGKTTRYALPSTYRRHVRAPRVVDLDRSFAATKKFIREVCQVDLDLEPRALRLIQTVPNADPAAFDSHAIWRLADAFTIVSASTQLSRRMEAKRILRDHVLSLCKSHEALPLFELLCVYSPRRAAEHALKTRNITYLVTCATFRSTRDELSNSDNLQPVLDSLALNETQWMPTEQLALFAMGKLARIKPLVADRIRDLRTLNDPSAPIVVWAALQFGSELESVIADVLLDEMTSPKMAAEIVSALTSYRNKSLAPAIVRLTKQNLNSEEHQEVVKASLRYLDLQPTTPEDVALLKRLKDYPFSSDVRSWASKKLGEE